LLGKIYKTTNFVGVMIAKGVRYEEGELVFEGLKDAEVLFRGDFKFRVEGKDLRFFVGDLSGAKKVYKEVVKRLAMSRFAGRIGFKYCRALGYSFLIYLERYEDGIEERVRRDPMVEDFDIVTLPNDDGYYFSTLYGLDNLNVPLVAVFSNTLRSYLDFDLSLHDLVNSWRLKFEESELKRKVERVDDVLQKAYVVRSVLKGFGDKYVEVQRVRKLGNGLCVYLSRNVRKFFPVESKDLVLVRVLEEGGIRVERFT